MGELLKKAASPEILNHAWRRLSADKAVWTPGLSRQKMERDLVFHLTTLARELESGRYRPNQIRMFTVTKASGKKRIISALTLRDKLAQRAVLTVLTPIFERKFHHDSFGYRPGRNIAQAMDRIRQHVCCGFPWLVDADIESFFDRIPHNLLVRTLRRYVSDRDLVTLIRRWLDVGAPRTGILCGRKGLGQGGVLSPLLCNMYLTNFDETMSAKNIPFVRFADDFLLFCPNKNAARAAHSLAEKVLKKLGLNLNKNKTQIVRSGPWVTFLGQKLFKPNKGIGNNR